MDSIPAYRILFLNELHDILLKINARTTTSVGFCRVLGRLVESDPMKDRAKLGSCFHLDHISSTRPFTCSNRRYLLENRKKNQMLNHEQDPVVVSKKHLGIVGLQKDPNVKNEDENENVDMVYSDNEVTSEQSTKTHNNKFMQPPPLNSVTIDLTTTSDEDEDDDMEKDLGSNPPRPGITSCPTSTASTSSTSSTTSTTSTSSSGIGRRGPKIVLRIDTANLIGWKPQVGQLFDFIGEVLYDDHEKHWILQAASFRSMEGLDLYTYRQAILLMRSFVGSSSR